MGSFADSIEAFHRKTKLSMDIIVRKVGLDLTRAVVARSPVDTGRFRGNWMLGVGSVNTTMLPDITDQDGGDTIEKIASGLDRVHAGGVFYITNSLPYAIPLEYGHSDQAPNGMVRLTVREYRTYIENAVRQLK